MFRSFDLKVMSLVRYLCANPILVTGSSKNYNKNFNFKFCCMELLHIIIFKKYILK